MANRLLHVRGCFVAWRHLSKRARQQLRSLFEVCIRLGLGQFGIVLLHCRAEQFHIAFAAVQVRVMVNSGQRVNRVAHFVRGFRAIPLVVVVGQDQKFVCGVKLSGHDGVLMR